MQPGQTTGTAWTAHIDDYAYLKGADPPSWAWEFLRRNPDYRRDAEVINQPGTMPAMPTSKLVVRQWHNDLEPQRNWGLAFFREPKSRCGGSRSVLARRRQSICRTNAHGANFERRRCRGEFRSSSLRLRKNRPANARRHRTHRASEDRHDRPTHITRHQSYE